MTTTHHDTIEIPAWANGPGEPGTDSGTGNGGWSAGLLAQALGDAALAIGVAVTLRVPPPIGRPLELQVDDTGASLLDAAVQSAEPVLVGRAEPAPVTLDVPAAVAAIDADTARAASAGFPFRERHPFPMCVSCGIARPAGMVSLGLHCGPVAGVHVDVDGATVPAFADAWTVGADVADPDDAQAASVAATWSALDCPSAAPVADPDAANPIVLARMAARVVERPRVGGTYVLAAWRVHDEGRKHHTRSVLLDPARDGAVLAAADALWIEVRPR